MTTVTGRLRRRIDQGSFADLTDAEVLDIAPVGNETAVIFDGALDAAQIAAVLNRMDSAGPADEAARANLRNLLTSGDPGLCEALTNYVLGE